MLPDKGWDSYEKVLRLIGERRSSKDQAEAEFLRHLGLVGEDGNLTERGDRYFKARFIFGDETAGTDALAEALFDYPPAMAVAQMLAGVAGANREAAEVVLRNQGFGDGLTDRRLGSLVALMHRAGIIKYSKSDASIHVLASPAAMPRLPSSIFVSPDTPFGNKAWLRRILRESKDFVWWLDKHFQHVAFDELWESVDGHTVKEIRILSLLLSDHGGKRVRRAYRDLRAEFERRGISLEWRTINSSHIRETHDRWIISVDKAWNVPNVNALYSGQHSELSFSGNRAELARIFIDYWGQASPFALEV